LREAEGVERFESVGGGVVRGQTVKVRVTSHEQASTLLAGGVPVGDVVPRLEYFDEPHLALALRRYVGHAARQLREGSCGAIALNLDQPTTS
jgi:hypothetical protein